MKRAKNVVYRAWWNFAEDDGRWFAYAIIAILFGIFIALVGLLGGCAVFGQRPQAAVSLEADRKLLADAQERVSIVQAAAGGANHFTTAGVLAGASESLKALEDGVVGAAPESDRRQLPASVQDAILTEFRGQIVVDPQSTADLERFKAERDALDIASREAHGQLAEIRAKATDLAGQVAARYGLGTVATGGGGLLVALGALAWRYRKSGQAVYAMVRAFQEAKHEVEAGVPPKFAEVVERHANANGAANEIKRVYRRMKKQAPAA